MTDLNLVLVLLGLLATVIIGVIQVTWMIARDVFRDKVQFTRNYTQTTKRGLLTTNKG